MFNIDRRYIDQPGYVETLQSRIITLRSKHRNDPTLPKPSQFGLTDEDFDDYIDRKHDLEDWQRSMAKQGPIWLFVLFCIPPVIISWKSPSNMDNATFFLSFLIGAIPCLVIWLIYKMIARMRERKLANEQCEQYIDALLQWAEQHDGK